MNSEEFIKWRDDYLLTRWNREEPFGYDHPETVEFIKDMMTATHSRYSDEEFRPGLPKLSERNSVLHGMFISFLVTCFSFCLLALIYLWAR